MDGMRADDDVDDDKSDAMKNTADEKLHRDNSRMPWISRTLSETAGRHTQLFWQPPTRYTDSSLSLYLTRIDQNAVASAVGDNRMNRCVVRIVNKCEASRRHNVYSPGGVFRFCFEGLRILQRVRISRNAERCNSQKDSVCLSVCSSRSGIVSRRMKIQSCGFQHLVGQSL